MLNSGFLMSFLNPKKSSPVSRIFSQASSGTTICSFHGARMTAFADSGSNQMLNSAAGVTLPCWKYEPPM